MKLSEARKASKEGGFAVLSKNLEAMDILDDALAKEQESARKYKRIADCASIDSDAFEHALAKEQEKHIEAEKNNDYNVEQVGIANKIILKEQEKVRELRAAAGKFKELPTGLSIPMQIDRAIDGVIRALAKTAPQEGE